MATTIIDLRRTDERAFPSPKPYWVTSGQITNEADDLAAILFSFPATDYSRIIVHEISCQIVIPFAGGTVSLDIGAHTIPLESTTDGGTATLVDADEYIPTASITEGTAGWYFPQTGDFLTAKNAGLMASPVTIIPADATVPCISAQLSSSATITAGMARVRALISALP